VRRRAPLPVLHEEPPSRRIALADLKPGECGWIAGDDGCCCGHATTRMLARGRHIASPYCGFHSARAYRPVQERRPVLASAASGQRGHFSSAAPAGRPPARPKPLRRGEGPRENFA
jgi:hypothetical protein